MRSRSVLLCLSMAFCLGSAGTLAQPASSEAMLAAAGFEEGEHYVRLPDSAASRSSSAAAEVAEFFMYGCIYCYRLEPRVVQWLENKPENVDFIRVPAIWNPTVELHSRAFYTAQALDLQEAVHAPFFREIHEARRSLQSTEAIAELFTRFGADEAEFRRTFESFGIKAQVRRADELARRYGVDQTPTFVVNGKYRTTRSMAGGDEKLFELIELLIETERR